MPEHISKPFKDMHPTLTVRGVLNLDSDLSMVLLNPIKLLLSPDDAQVQRLQMMCALLRLVGTMEWATKDGIDGIDALAGCPIFMFDEDHIQDFSLLEKHEQRHVILVVFYVCNWIIEVLNAFCVEPGTSRASTRCSVEDSQEKTGKQLAEKAVETKRADDDMKNKMVLRANQLLRLLGTLDHALGIHAEVLPDLNACVDVDASASGVGSASSSSRAGASKPKAAAKGKAKAKPKAKSKGKGKGKGKADDEDSDASDNSAKPKPTSKKAAGKEKKGKDRDDDEEDEDGCAASEKGAAAGTGCTGGVNNNNKTKMQLASSTGFLTELVNVRSQATCFRELDLTVHNVCPSPSFSFCCVFMFVSKPSFIEPSVSFAHKNTQTFTDEHAEQQTSH